METPVIYVWGGSKPLALARGFLTNNLTQASPAPSGSPTLLNRTVLARLDIQPSIGTCRG